MARIPFALLQLVFNFGPSRVHRHVPVREVARRLLQRQCIEVPLRGTVGHLLPLKLDARALSPCILQLLAPVWVHHVNLGKVRLEFLYALDPTLLDHVIHLVIVVIGRLHVPDIGVAA